jgi:GPH family glycoside/pentoside/hexuronide:cation symporter
MLRYGTVQFLGGFVLFFLILIPAIEITTIWIGLIFSTFFAGAGIFGVILQTLPIDQDEINYGSRREGMFYGINALFTRPAESIGPIIAALILAVFGYQQNSIVQSPEAILGIKIIWYIVVNIFAAIALIFVYYYPIHGETLKQLEIDLEKLHEKKKARSSLNKDDQKRNEET